MERKAIVRVFNTFLSKSRRNIKNEVGKRENKMKMAGEKEKNTKILRNKYE